jgi:hypothetical protein
VWAKNILWARPCLSVCRVIPRQPAWPGVIVGTYCCNNGANLIVGTNFCNNMTGAYFWLITMISDHTIAPMTLDIIVAFVVAFEQEWCKSIVPLRSGCQRSNLLTSPSMIWREEHLWTFSVLQRVHLSNLVSCVFDNILISLHFNSQTCCLFNDAVISSNERASNDRMTNGNE